MAAVRLADHAVFDDTDGAGVILDTRTGFYLSLNPTATLLLEAALVCSTQTELLDRLRPQIEASDTLLEHGLSSLTAQLEQHALLFLQEGQVCEKETR